MTDTALSSDWHDAFRTSYAAGTPLPPVSISLMDAVGERLAGDLAALCDVPHYPSSAMDGWAVAGSGPWQLVDSDTLQAGAATPIVTGGLIPIGAHAVLQTEHGRVDASTLTASADAEPGGPADGMHIRPVGEEVRADDIVIRIGTVLNPAHLAVAAVCGHDDLIVLARARVRLIFTGNEVVTEGVPAPGHVRDTFGPQLPAVVRMLGGTVSGEARLGDDRDLLVAELMKGAAASDLVITTGGTGNSSADHLHPALEELNATVLIDEIAMRPGGPSLLARLPDGRFLVGLPGNPLAAMMGMLTIARPLLARLAGAAEPRLGQVPVAVDLAGRPGRMRLAPYRLVDGAAEPSRWFGSAMLRGLAEADGVLLCPPQGLASGAAADTVPLPWPLVESDGEKLTG